MTNTNRIGFGVALDVLKRGGCVAREGWNGKGMFLFLVVDFHALAAGNSETVANAGALPKAPFLAMKTADDRLVPWLASQTDILAEDWTVTTDA